MILSLHSQMGPEDKWSRLESILRRVVREELANAGTVVKPVRQPRAAKRQIGDWVPSEDLVSKLQARYQRTPEQMQQYYTELRDYCLRTGRQYSDYDAAYRTAVRNSWGQNGKQR